MGIWRTFVPYILNCYTMHPLIARWIQPIVMPFIWQDFLLAIPRLLGGYWMTTYFGSPKFGLPWSDPDKNLSFLEVVYWFPTDVAEYGGIFALLAPFLAWMGAFAEGVGGIAWLLGWQTRFFSVLIGATMVVAALFQQFDNGLWNMLPALGFLWLSLFYGILGSGRFGLDFVLTRKPSRLVWANPIPVFVLTLALAAWSPVQESKEQRVLFQLDTSSFTGDIQTVGIRGEGNPLSWRTDFPLVKNEKTGLYEGECRANTGYAKTEVKFVINGEFEFQDDSNRVIYFAPDQNTRVRSTWNRRSDQ